MFELPTPVILSGVSFRPCGRKHSRRTSDFSLHSTHELKAKRLEVLRLRSGLKADRNCAQNDRLWDIAESYSRSRDCRAGASPAIAAVPGNRSGCPTIQLHPPTFRIASFRP